MKEVSFAYPRIFIEDIVSCYTHSMGSHYNVKQLIAAE